MNSVEQAMERHVYRIKTWLKALYCLMGLFFACIGILTGYMDNTRHVSGLPAVILLLATLCPGAYMVALAWCSRLVLDGTRIKVRGVFREKTADQSEIEGFRTVSSRNGTYTVLQLKDGRGTISIPSSFEKDDDYRDWFQQIEDLDERDRKKILAEIEQHQDLGATPEERVAALKSAKTLSIGALGLTVAAAAGVNFGSGSLLRASAVVLALAPAAAWYLLQSSPLLYVFFKRKKDPRAALSFLLLVAGFGLLMRMREISFVSMQPLLLLMAVAASAVILGFYSSAQSGAGRGAVFGLLLLGGVYGYGLVAVADTFFDGTAGVSYSAPVVGKHISSGRSTTYYLRLAPWGPVQSEKDVSVSSVLYAEVTPGTQVCAELHPGTLHAAWYRVRLCSLAIE